MTTSRPAARCSSISWHRLVVDERVDQLVQGLGDDVAHLLRTSQPVHSVLR